MGRNIQTYLSMDGAKVLINSMGANKTRKAALRCTSTVNGKQEVTFSYEQTAGVTVNSTRHTRKSSEADEQLMMALPLNTSSWEMPSFISSNITTMWIDWCEFHRGLPNTSAAHSNQTVEEGHLSEEED